MASMPPNTRSGGPPPGATPVGLSSMQMDPLQSQDSEPSGGGGGIGKMFYAIENSLDSLASVIPQEADSIDDIKNLLREVLARAVSQGAAFGGSETSSRENGLRSGTTEPLI